MIPGLTKDYNLEMALTKAKCDLECKNAALDCIHEIVQALCSMKELSYFAVFDKIEEVKKKKYEEWKVAGEAWDVAHDAFYSDCERRDKEFQTWFKEEFGKEFLP